MAAAMARPYSMPTSSAMRPRPARRQQGQRLAEQGDQQVVVADRELEGFSFPRR
jgi:hypothetical protein